MIVHEDSTVTVHAGDCLDVLRMLPDASVDSVVTDPPYGLEFMGKEWDAPWKAEGKHWREASRLPGSHSTNPTPRPQNFGTAGLPFQKWCELWSAECLRVLKPGGHLLAFGGTRTWHRLACAVEDAGFEIRDSIAWLYGSGFPKSLDVSKAIDKRRDDGGDVRHICRWLRARIDGHPTETIKTLAARFGFHPRMVEHWAARDSDSQPTLPTLDQWDSLREALSFDDEVDGEVLRLNLRKGEPGEAWADRPVTGQVTEWADRVNYALTSRDGLRRDIPATDDARTWQGWGTALKPAFEPIVVARKPLTGTVAANVLRHGTGALNIDATRIGETGGGTNCSHRDSDGDCLGHPAAMGSLGGGVMRHSAETAPAGRWPANVVLDESQAAELDAMSGESKSPPVGSVARTQGGDTIGTFNHAGREPSPNGHGDSGGASRFFYTAKADAGERVRVDGIAHPTVKPLALMRWLVRLVTPPGGVVLEPFAGSGTTVEACILEGFRCIAIERETDYLPLILQRINRRRDPVAAVKGAGEDGGLFDLLDVERVEPNPDTRAGEATADKRYTKDGGTNFAMKPGRRYRDGGAA